MAEEELNAMPRRSGAFLFKKYPRNGNFYVDKLPIRCYNSITELERRSENLELKEAREKAGMTIHELAEKVGVSDAAICRYEQGKRIPKTPIAKRLANELGLIWYELIDIQRGA